MTISSRTKAPAHGRNERVPGTFPAPTGLAYDHQGNLYVSEWSAHRVRRIDRASGAIRTLRGRIGSPTGIAVDADGQVLVASYDEGVVYRLRPEDAPWPALQPEPEVVLSGLGTPSGLVLARDRRTLLIADRGLGQVWRVDRAGRVETRIDGLPLPLGVAELPDGALAVSTLEGGVIEIRPDGTRQAWRAAPGTPAAGLVADGADAVLVADAAETIWRATRSGSVEPWMRGLARPVALARCPLTRELAVGTWGDASVWRVRPLQGPDRDGDVCRMGAASPRSNSPLPRSSVPIASGNEWSRCDAEGPSSDPARLH